MKIDGYDDSGRTALHFAPGIIANFVAARHSIKMGATPNLFNNHGQFLPYFAAEILNTEMICFWMAISVDPV